jgi:dGTP triphosphohydrolase
VYNHVDLLDKRNYSKNIVHKLFIYFKKNNNKLPKDWINQDIEIERLICDYISGMTDRFAINLYKEIYE